jgi:hypothetical protein
MKNRRRTLLAAIVIAGVGAAGAPPSPVMASERHCTDVTRPGIFAQVCVERLSPDSARGLVWLTNTSALARLNSSIGVELVGRGSLPAGGRDFLQAGPEPAPRRRTPLRPHQRSRAGIPVRLADRDRRLVYSGIACRLIGETRGVKGAR